jgi:CelD/BcsL family acetyltransferase involved in cellulose biosynthesis
MDDGARRTWDALRDGNPALASPYFSWEFTDAVARARGDVEVAVLADGGRAVGFLPFQRTSPRTALPVGSPLNDFQGVIGAPSLDFDPVEALAACGVERFEYDHVVADQSPFTPFHDALLRSPRIDLSAGLEPWRAARRAAGHGNFERVRTASRALARRHGALRFELDVRDPRVLDQLLALKSAQYRRTLGEAQDLFANATMATIVRDLFGTRTDRLSGLLSALWAGDTLVAAHFGMRARGLVHWWFPAYDPAFGRFSAGATLLLSLVEAAPAAGITVVDLGKGDEPYKLRFANDATLVGEGVVDGREAALVQAYLGQELEDARLRRTIFALQREKSRLEAAMPEPPAAEPSAPRSADVASPEAETLRLALAAARHDARMLRASWSWRLTAPLRAAAELLRCGQR